MPDPDPGIDEAVGLIAARPARLGAVKLVALDGPSGSGKTTLAARLVALLVASGVRSASLSTDLLATWDQPFDWWPELEASVLQPLSVGEVASLSTIAWTNGEPGPGSVVTVEPPDVLVLEGVSSGRRAVAERISALVWVEGPGESERLERAVARDGETNRHRLRDWQSAEAAFFLADGTRDRADLVISG